jgi:hypothetical protein
MPTSYEISINNFQSYPTEIRLYLQNFYRDYIKDRKKEDQIKDLKNIDFSKGPNTSNYNPNTSYYRTSIPPNNMKPVSVYGGKIFKKNTKKYKLKKLNLNTRRNKSKFTNTKTKKYKIKKNNLKTKKK